MSLAAGVDVAKEIHWAEIKVAETGKVLASRRVESTPQDIAGLISDIRAAGAVHGPAVVGLDILGGIASLLTVMLLEDGLAVVHVPGLAVNRARQGTAGGEHKSDPKDARVIAGQVRMREDLRPVTAMRDQDAELRLLAGRRRELVTGATRRAARLRDLLVSVHPGLERVTDVTTRTGLHLLTRYVTPAQIRAAGQRRVLAHLRRLAHVRDAQLTALAGAAITAATAQQASVPAEAAAADLIKDIAAGALAAKERLRTLDKRIEEALARHPDAALIRSLPGMGATLTAEFLAVTGGITRFPGSDQLASAAGLAPILRQSGKVRYLQRARTADKALNRVFCQSAFVATHCDPASKACYRRKRTEGKTRHQAVLSLARRRVNVLHAILRTRTPYDAAHSRSAA